MALGLSSVDHHARGKLLKRTAGEQARQENWAEARSRNRREVSHLYATDSAHFVQRIDDVNYFFLPFFTGGERKGCHRACSSGVPAS
jgi:hypothetical protein